MCSHVGVLEQIDEGARKTISCKKHLADGNDCNALVACYAEAAQTQVIQVLAA